MSDTLIEIGIINSRVTTDLQLIWPLILGTLETKGETVERFDTTPTFAAYWKA